MSAGTPTDTAAGAPTVPSAAVRKELLLMRSATLRGQLAQDAQVLRAPLALADSVRDGLRWLRQNPEWPLGGVVLLLVLKPRRTWRWISRGWWAWRLWQRAARLLAGSQR